MKLSGMKNIVILKNLPSNLLEEAIIVVKDNKKILDKDYLFKGNEEINQGYMKEEDFKKIEKIQKDSRKYVMKEAEFVINNYLEKIDDKQKSKEKDKLENKCNRLKYLSIILTIATFASTFICAIK